MYTEFNTEVYELKRRSFNMKKLVPATIATLALLGMASTVQADFRTYRNACAACHSTGAAGAPKTGDKAAWKARIEAGMDILMKHAMEGKGAMPAKGGRPNLTEAQIKSVVEYMVAESK